MLRSYELVNIEVSPFTSGELRSIDFTTGEHQLRTGDFLSGSIFTTCEQKWGQMEKGCKIRLENKLMFLMKPLFLMCGLKTNQTWYIVW